MATSAADLQARRAQMQADSKPAAQTEDRTEKTVHMLDTAEKVEALNPTIERITIGTPPIEVAIMPMTPAQMVKAWPLLTKLFKPMAKMAQASQIGQVDFESLLDSIGTDVSFVPELLWLILERGNKDIITKEFVNDHLNFIEDAIKIFPIFLKQNPVQKLFMGKQTPPPAPSSNADGGTQSVEAEISSTT